MGRKFKTIVVDEYLTSQLCPFCAGELKKSRAYSIRFYKCPHDDADEKKKEHNKDYLAAYSVLQLGLALLLGERLDPWQRKDDDDDNSNDDKKKKKKTQKKTSKKKKKVNRDDDDDDDDDDDGNATYCEDAVRCS